MIKRYYNMGTKIHDDTCHEYIGMHSYKVNGTVKASNRCKSCYKFNKLGHDKDGHYVECKE